MQVPFVDLYRLHAPLEEELKTAFANVLRSSSFIGGPLVSRFEADFARYTETPFAVGVSSGTAALELILRACGIGPGDEVLVPAMTFMATAASVSATGATPVFAEIDLRYYTLDSRSAESRLNPKTKAVMPVHLYGQVADMDAISDLAKRKGLLLIEDAAQAQGARYAGKLVGSWGQATGYSFYPGKNLGAFGDAGAVTTLDENLDRKVRMLRDHGSYGDKYRHQIAGFNHRLDSLQAAILEIKLKHLDSWNDSRRKAAAGYRQLLAGLDLVLPEERPDSKHIYHLFVVLTPRRDALKEALKQRGIDTGFHYPVPLHLQPAFSHLRYREGDFPVAERIAREGLSLPMFAGMTAAEVEYVSNSIREFFGAGASHQRH